MRPIDEAFHLFTTPQRIFITTHHKPDGDAIGSMLALFHYLKGKGHFPSAVSPGDIPEYLHWLPGIDQVLNFEQNPDKVAQALASAQWIIGVDFNDLRRTERLGVLLQSDTRPRIMIDHHLHPKDYWTYGISDPAKSSTCELLYDVIVQMGDEKDIDRDLATCLYTGAMTDSGSFRFPSVTPHTHDMIADLLRRGISHSEIHAAVFDSWSAKRMQFLGWVLLEKMKIFPEWHAGYIALSAQDLKLFGALPGDTEGLVNYPLSISGIRFSALITERGDEVRLSLRSKGHFDVSAFAREYFHGGGHFHAAGGKSKKSFTETIEQFKQILSEIHPE